MTDLRSVPPACLAYMERVAGCEGQEAVDLWIHCTEQFTSSDGLKRGKVYPRYQVHRETGEITPVKLALHPHCKDWKTYRRAEPDEALAWLVEHLKREGRY